MTKLIDALHFQDNPFANYSAENEPEIDRYFVRPPYYEFIQERGLSGRSVILFGARGAGKSATRIAFTKESWTRQEGKRPLIVTFDDFSRALPGGLDTADLAKFMAELGYLVVEALLLWLATQSKDERDVNLQTMTDHEESTMISFVQRFYLSRPDFVREASVREPLKLLQQAWHGRAKLWFSGRWDTVVAVVSSIAQALGTKATGTQLNVEGSLTALLKAEPKEWSDAQFARALLVRLTGLARIFGFSGITVLVDKVDETPYTNNSSSSTAKLLYPLLANTQLLEVDGLAWLFFLWDKVHDEYKTDAYPVRLDKIANATISWDDSFLESLIARRLVHFSNERVSNFAALCDETVVSDTAFSEIINMSMRSPRELIRILDTIIREHDDEHSLSEQPPRLLQSSIDRGLDRYTLEALRRSFDRKALQQIARLKLVSFINRDVQQAFRINDQSARNRIRGWADSGIVSQTGSRSAEGGGAGKPSHEYSVIDFRVKRMVQRELKLGSDFEVGSELDD